MTDQRDIRDAIEVHYPNGERRISTPGFPGSRGPGSTTQDVRGYETSDGAGFVVTERVGPLNRH